MHPLRKLYAMFFIFLLLSPILSYADSIGLANMEPAKTPANNFGSIGYQDVPKNLTPKEATVVSNDLDCVDGTGELNSGGWYNEKTFCPAGYMPHEMRSSDPPQGNVVYKTIKEAFGTVYYRLRCCKAQVIYS